MKLIESTFSWKTISYKGYYLIAPFYVNFVACDADGTVIGFENKPHAEGWGDIWEDGDCGKIEYLAIFDLEGTDWTETLEEV